MTPIRHHRFAVIEWESLKIISLNLYIPWAEEIDLLTRLCHMQVIIFSNICHAEFP